MLEPGRRQVQTRSKVAGTGPSRKGARVQPCPSCGGDILRIRRRTTDRLVSLLSPLNRYQCTNFQCQWKGNFRLDREGRAMQWSKRWSRVSLTFVASMALLVVAAVAAVGLGLSELLPEFAQAVVGLFTPSDKTH